MENTIVVKKWYQSKTVYFNVIMTVLGVIASLQGDVTFDKYAVLMGLVTVIGNTILRVYFTNSNISSSTTTIE